MNVKSSKYYEAATNDYISYEDTENKYIGTNQHGYLEFYTVDYAYDLENVITEAYSSELNNYYEEEYVLDSKDVAESVIEIINKVYSPQENETVVLLEGVKVEEEKIIEYEKTLEENGITFGTGKSDYHSVSEYISDEMYYLNFGIELDGILEERASNSYYNVADANKDVSWVNINVIVDNGEIIFLYMGGLYELEECQSCSVMSVEEALDVLKNKYNLEIINSLQNITKVDIRYVFYDDFYSDEELDGYIMPYWCFENTTSNFVDRINAVTGDDFEYE